MRLPTVAAAALVLLGLGGCASLRGPVEGGDGPTLTILNEWHRPLDLSSRCVENGPLHRLGAVDPGSSGSFVLRPAHCSTVYLVHHPVGPLRADPPVFATVPMFGDAAVELVMEATGILRRRAAVQAAR